MKTNIKIVVGILLGILLIGIISASLLTYFGQITGEVTVEGPVFYAGKTTEGDFHLWINDLDKFNQENEGIWTNISGTEEKTFFTDVLEETNFYNPEIEMQVEAKLIEGSPPKKLRLEFGYFDQSPDGSLSIIGDCIKEVNITSVTDYETKSLICQGNSEISSLRGFYYRIEGMGTGDVKINIKTDNGETKAKVLGAAD